MGLKWKKKSTKDKKIKNIEKNKDHIWNETNWNQMIGMKLKNKTYKKWWNSKERWPHCIKKTNERKFVYLVEEKREQKVIGKIKSMGSILHNHARHRWKAISVPP